MASLQRSSKSFRRQGSSGWVWDDKKLLGDINQMTKKVDQRELRPCQSINGSLGSSTAPIPYARCLSASANSQSSPFSTASEKPPPPKSKLEKLA